MQEPDQDYDYEFKFLIVGDVSSGKSSLLVRWTHENFPSSYNATIGMDIVSENEWDTAGQDRFRTLTASYYRGSHGVLVVYDITRQDSFDNLKVWIEDIDKYCSSHTVQKVLIGNKTDLDHERVVEFGAGKALADSWGVPFLETSAKANFHVHEAFTTLCQLVKNSLQQQRVNSGPILLRTSSSSHVSFMMPGLCERKHFREKIQSGQVPLPIDINDQDTFSGYYFREANVSSAIIPIQSVSHLKMLYSWGISKDPFSGVLEHFVTLQLASTLTEVARPAMNFLFAVSTLNSGGSEWNPAAAMSKLDAVKEAWLGSLSQMNDSDGFGYVMFSDRVVASQPLKSLAACDIDALRMSVLELEACESPAGSGSRLPKAAASPRATSNEFGLRRAIEMLEEYAAAGSLPLPSRIIFITDTSIDEKRCIDLARKAARRQISVTFLLLSAQFSLEVVNDVATIRGANYFSVNAPADVKQLLDENFDLTVTPALFDLSIQLESMGWRVDQIYGSPFSSEKDTNVVLKVATIFATRRHERSEPKGGLILIKLSRVLYSNINQIALVMRYELPSDEASQHSNSVAFQLGENVDNFYQSSDVRKAILLARYVLLLQSWSLDARNDYLFSLNNGIGKGKSLRPVPKNATYRGGPMTLQVGDRYKPLFVVFSAHFAHEEREIGDPTLEQELGVLHRIQNSAIPKQGDGKGCCS